MPASISDQHTDGVEGALRDVLCALPPGWAYSFDFDAWRDAVSSAQHQATLRGEELLLLDPGAAFTLPLVSIGKPGTRGRLFTLAVVRFALA